MGWKDFHFGRVCVLLVLVLALGDDCVIAKLGDISRQKCSEWYSSNSSLPTTAHVNASSLKDGFAEPGQFPHAAALRDENDTSLLGCAGILITEKYVITHALCLRIEGSPIKYVRFGDFGRQINATDQSNIQTIKVAKTIFHPKYNSTTPQYYNIALIELATNVKIDDFVRPACLHTEPALPEGPDETWRGFTIDRYEESWIMLRLKEINLKSVTHAVCQASARQVFGGNFTVDFEGDICTSKDIYEQLPLGGPLQTKNSRYPSGYSVFGVLSYFFSRTNDASNVIFVFERVSYHLMWIESIISKT